MNFTELDLNPELQKGISEANFITCTEVQKETFLHAFEGQDVYAQSQTGTGKTAAFLITLFQNISTSTSENKQALILVPTRELAVQIEEEAKLIGKFLNLKVASFYGGVGYFKQEELLKKGVDIIIGTPGRLIDFCKTDKISLKNIGTLVIDEADRMFDMGFIPDIKFLINQIPQTGKRHTMLFSATLNNRVRNLAWEYMKDPHEIEIEPENVTVENITQALYHVGYNEKMQLLLGILNKEKPNNVIIFANTKHSVEEISKRLEINGYSNQYIIGDLPQRKRQKIIDNVKAGKINFLIATDVAARGLHVDNLDLVINYDLPEDSENYVHRIGRTARAGKSGKAISMACERYVYGLDAIETTTKIKIPVERTTNELFVEDKSANIEMPNKNRKERHHDKRKSNKTSNYKKHSYKGKPKSNKPYQPKTTTRIDHKKLKKLKVLRKGTIEQRMQYYKEKYGDDFIITPEMIKAEKRRMKQRKAEKSLIRKIFNFFKK